MKKWLLLLVPAVLWGQVVVDTIIHFEHAPFNGFYLLERNKLYLHTCAGTMVLDCSTWVVTPIPTNLNLGKGYFAYSPAQHKLYLYGNSWAVIDVTSDSVVGPLPLSRKFWGHMAYVAGRDQMYISGDSGMAVLDCATDSVIKAIPSPIPGCRSVHRPAYDSVANQIWAETGNFWGGRPYFAVYGRDDSLIRVIGPLECWPDPIVFCHEVRKGYFTPWDDRGSKPGVVALDRLELIKSFPIQGWPDGIPVVHPADCKVYIPGDSGTHLTNSLFVIDCRTDSIVRSIRIPSRYPVAAACWVPWGNRLYASTGERFFVVDCVADAIIQPNVVVPGMRFGPTDFQLDSTRQRIFAVFNDPETFTGAVAVLRDMPDGIAEERGPKLAVASPPRLFPSPARDRVWLEGAGRATLFTPDGRKAAVLARGSNDVRHLSRGVYFVRSPERRESKRVVLVE